MQFEQATIPVQDQAGFERLKSAIAKALAPAAIDSFFSGIASSGLLVREFEQVLNKGLIDPHIGGKAGATYQSLPLSDQSQIREFYLTQVEEVPGEARARHRNIFKYS